MSGRTLLCIDFINDIIDPRGKLSTKGHASFAEQHQTLYNVAALQKRARESGDLVLHVKIGFSASYVEQPLHSPLFGKAKEYDALKLGAWGTDFHDTIAPVNGERVIIKHRVSAFFATPLESLLHLNEITELCIAGVATDLAVEAAARDAHDRDFIVNVLHDCCAAASDEDHNRSLATLKKIAKVSSFIEGSSMHCAKD
jgi:nicotinamidase-related amidase